MIGQVEKAWSIQAKIK